MTPDISINYRKVLTFTKDFVEPLAVAIKDWVYMDAKNGTAQFGFDTYKSNSYIKQKARGMKSALTNKRYNRYAGVSIVSKHVANVNFMLTGQLKLGLHLDSFISNRFTMAYEKKDEMKLKGNRERYANRDERTLTPENQEKVRKQIENFYYNNLLQEIKDKVSFTINL